ncbi:alpha/beta hydrolase [Kibdelosporangium philippinense]|uniref:Alpha/beta hydrolase n=1 Tax=Kibdelosporangium philippinense TaxID=211113 RepID=A0ABS8ZJN3_9PSEU|nr:alpha/beta fold hydrolase [Kibdelosporangium philippinense]MCE7008025.1 alpha/beta hydrolase [Kibdelosporangium philippinense]
MLSSFAAEQAAVSMFGECLGNTFVEKQELQLATMSRKSGEHLIVFMHGIGCAKECYADAFQAAELADFSLCALDFPGHGQAPSLRENTVEAYAEVALDRIEAVGAKRVSLVAHSMGGAVGLLVAQRMDVACFVSVEGNLVAEDCALVSAKTARMSFDMFTTKGFYRFSERLRQSERKDVQAWARWYPQCDPVAIHQISRSLVDWSDGGQLLEYFLNIKNRAYVYGGAEERVDYLLPLLKHTKTYSVPDSGHFAMVDNPAGFYEIVAGIVTEE